MVNATLSTEAILRSSMLWVYSIGFFMVMAACITALFFYEPRINVTACLRNIS